MYGMFVNEQNIKMLIMLFKLTVVSIDMLRNGKFVHIDERTIPLESASFFQDESTDLSSIGTKASY